MAGNSEISETCMKEEDRNELKSNINVSDIISCKEEDEEEDICNDSLSNIVKRYTRYDLLPLRNAQLSLHYPHCALRPELQSLSIWTCRLRCELQYLCLWKIPITGNSYGNCNCNGTCQSYACDGQPYSSSNSEVNAVNSQVSYGNVQQSKQLPPLQTSPSPTLNNKKAVRSRERFLSYQRCINTELIRDTSPSCSDTSTQQHLSHQIKPAFIDQRSISSSHLMPAFAKRRMGNANGLHGQSDVGSNINNSATHITDYLYNNDVASDNSTRFETSVKSRRDSVKVSNNQTNFHLYKGSANNQLDKSDQLVDNQSGWINLVKKINSDFSQSNNKTNNIGGVNKKLIYERRIGSGRLVPREVVWDIRAGNNKQLEKENLNMVNNNGEKDNEILPVEADKLSNRNASNGRYSDTRHQIRRVFDRRKSNSEDSNNGCTSNTSKRHSTNVAEERNNFDCNYHQQTTHFPAQRSMSFRRREYGEHKDHHRDFRESKNLRDGRENRDQRGDQNHHNIHRDHKEEPEWFSEGPTSQHDTIELRGFEETDDSEQQQEQSSGQYSKIEGVFSESSLQSHNNSSNVNLPTKDSFDIPSEVFNNTINTFDKETDNGSNGNDFKDTVTPQKEVASTNESTTPAQQTIPKSEECKNSAKRKSDVTGLFFDNFLSIEALENTLIGSGQSLPVKNDECGTSRFSRWFFNSSNNNINASNEFNTNLLNKEDSKPLNKDLNESDFNSFMSFLKYNNFPIPELPKALPSNVSALSVEELEARMRTPDSDEVQRAGCGSQNLKQNDITLPKRSECESESDISQQAAEITTQDVEAFRKLLDQLGKPRVDISMNIILPHATGQSQSAPSHVGAYPAGISPISPTNSLPQSSMTKQEYMVKVMHHQQQLLYQQQNMGKTIPPPLQHHPHHRITQMSSQHAENMPLMPVPYHSHAHNMPMIISHAQKRHDVQHLIQSVAREELSRSFLEKQLKNHNIPPYTKEVISTVLKETSRYNLTVSGLQSTPDSIETTTPSDTTAVPNNLMQSLARGEVSLNLLERELNKLAEVNPADIPASGAFKDKSRCGTPLTPSLNVTSLPTSGRVIVPLTLQVVPPQKQYSVLTSDSDSSDQQQHQSGNSTLRLRIHEDSLLHLPTQRELQMHTQAIMQNALFKKKLETEQSETLKRRQEVHKQQEIESASISQQHQHQLLNSNSTISQQGHQQSLRLINSPTPLAFTPTSVLRKMTAEKETHASSTRSAIATSQQQIQTHLQQSHLKFPTHPQPRMILGGGNFQYTHQQQHQMVPTTNGSPQISPQQKSKIRNPPTGCLKWPLIHAPVESNHTVLNTVNNKPMGRPILKGPGPLQPVVTYNAHNTTGQNQSNVNQNSQSIQIVSQIPKYQSLQPRQIVGQQFSNHITQHQIPTNQQSNMHQQLFTQQPQQRPVIMQCQQIQQNDLGNHTPLSPPVHHPACNDNNSITNLNYQRDGGLSPTSNQLAQWFSPELLAQASAGKLPLLNMNQALSLEEFERSIQHSSTAVNN